MPAQLVKGPLRVSLRYAYAFAKGEDDVLRNFEKEQTGKSKQTSPVPYKCGIAADQFLRK